SDQVQDAGLGLSRIVGWGESSRLDEQVSPIVGSQRRPVPGNCIQRLLGATIEEGLRDPLDLTQPLRDLVINLQALKEIFRKGTHLLVIAFGRLVELLAEQSSAGSARNQLPNLAKRLLPPALFFGAQLLDQALGQFGSEVLGREEEEKGRQAV